MSHAESEFALGEELLGRIDAWRSVQDARPTRSQAVVELIKAGLRGSASSALSLGDKLTLTILCEINRKVGGEGMIDSDFLEAAIQGGHNWAIEWQHPSLSHGHINSQVTADFVVRVLSMWKRIEESFDQLAVPEKERVRKEAGFSGDPQFPGWSSAEEANYKSIARFMTDRMELFPMFEGRSALDSRVPVVGRYKSMLKCLEGFGRDANDRRLSADELVVLFGQAGS
ncbi:YfbU domain-containing protein [Novosphingobium sp. CF614]|uniref:YfbU family protein n=1 Tax=Novosphingobium sp. CF614 TaxID=1884364 RepID=UPI0008ED7DB4|nr:YfbU family protein [Novosphingobium sp. CF614]SFF77642.1 YfbU domain-containing protein [Novosphingobium sp. CF614]